MYEKLKSFLLDDALFYSLLIILIALIAFQLGRQSEMAQNKAEIAVPPVVMVSPETGPSSVPTSGVAVVGSRSGTKYHLPDCPGALQMKKENRIEFASIEAAEAAGYEPAGNCPGL